MRKLTALLSILSLVTLAACGDDKNNGNGIDRDGDIGRLPDAGPDTGNDTDTGLDAGSDTGNNDGGTDGGEPDAPVCDQELTAGGPTAIVINREERFDIGVSLKDCEGAGVDGVIIDFEILGEPNGSALRNTSARTDSGGSAAVTLVAGNLDAVFEIEASYADLQPVLFTARVMGAPNGDISVVLEDLTTADLTDASVFLFQDITCEEIDVFDPLGASLINEPVGFGPPSLFDGLEPGTFVVAAQGRVDTNIMGFGCVEDIDVADGGVTDVNVELKLIPIRYTGIYELDNHFDLAGVLPNSVEDTLRILDELSDDNAISGSPATDEWGVDPAAFVLDFVYRELCCWEAMDTNPGLGGFQGDFESCQAQEFTHATGDLEQLYTEDFSTWDGAQSSFPSACTLLSLGNVAVQTQVQNFIEANVPGVALRLIDIAGDLSRAVTEMNIISELTIGEVAVGKNGTFTHELISMVVELHNLDGDLSVYEFDLADAGFENLDYSSETTAQAGDVLVIPEHSFRLDFGRLLRFVFTDILLPTLDCDRDHDGVTEPCEDTADLVGTWVDCTQVAEWLIANIPIPLFTLGTYEGICNIGVDAAGGAIEAGIESAVDAETTLTLEGTTVAGEVDAFREATTLINGVWDGALVEDDADYGAFPGEFTGVRTSDLD